MVVSNPWWIDGMHEPSLPLSGNAWARHGLLNVDRMAIRSSELIAVVRRARTIRLLFLLRKRRRRCHRAGDCLKSERFCARTHDTEQFARQARLPRERQRRSHSTVTLFARLRG